MRELQEEVLKMSVVISYYNDRFALILTDRMVTSGFAHWEEKKLYNDLSYPYGACAEAGLAKAFMQSGIFSQPPLILMMLK